MPKVQFTYEPLTLVRLLMDRYAESLEGKHTKAKQFARYEYLRTMTDGELESFLRRYLKETGADAITLKDWKKDCEILFDYVYESDRYRRLILKFQRKGYGRTGLGVVDKSDNSFYDCAFANHWQTIQDIMRDKYPHLSEALDEMAYNDRRHEFNGVTRKELDEFILNRFELVGERKPLNEYMN